MDNTKPTLRQKFERLPELARVWLASEEATFIIIELNQRLGLDGVLIEVIPNSITRLAVRELEPKEFINDISDGLGIEWIVAQGIAQEIERKILRPVEIPLRNEVGVDIKAIFLAKPPAAFAPTPPTPPRVGAPTDNVRAAMPPISRPTPPPAPIPPTPPIPTSAGVGIPTNSVGTTPKEIPVKINVQPARPDQPFGSDSWVNKIK